MFHKFSICRLTEQFVKLFSWIVWGDIDDIYHNKIYFLYNFNLVDYYHINNLKQIVIMSQSYKDVFDHFGEQIAQLDSEKLKELYDNDEALDESVDYGLQGFIKFKDEHLEKNRTIAESNLAKEPVIIELKSRLAELNEEGKQCCESVQEKMTVLKNKRGYETALALLQASAAESEESSEALVKKFTDNEISVDNFLEDFLNVRVQMHLRKLKAEKMQELLRSISVKDTNISIPMPTSSVPYPMLPTMPLLPPRH